MRPKAVSNSDELTPDEPGRLLNQGEEILRELTPPKRVLASAGWCRGRSMRAEREGDHAHAPGSPPDALGARGYTHEFLHRGVPCSRVEAIRVSEEQRDGFIALETGGTRRR